MIVEMTPCGWYIYGFHPKTNRMKLRRYYMMSKAEAVKKWNDETKEADNDCTSAGGGRVHRY